MSLQVWLPLNGNANNQGLLDNVNSTGLTFTTGKIGQAMVSGNINMSASQTAKVLNNNEVSIAFWCKVFNNVSTSGILFGNNPMGANNNRKFTIFNYPDMNSLHWSWMNDAASTTFAGGVINNFFPTDTWTHCAIVYKNPIVYIYKNGTLIGTHTNCISNSSTFQYDTNIITGNANRAINDFRLYNHALSDKEVKEIAKGLVLHYPFNDLYPENTTNLFASINTSLSNAPIGTTTLWTDQTNGTQEVVEFDGKKCFKFTYNGNSNRFYVTTPNPKVKATYSCKMYCESSANVLLHIERYPNYNWGGGDGVYTKPGTWQTVNLTLDNSYEGETCYFFIYGNSTAPVYVCDFQIEEKDHVTPYTPSSRNENIIYDSSGYKYDAALIGPEYYKMKPIIKNLLGNPNEFLLSNITNNSGDLTYTPNVLAMANYDLPTPIVGHKYYGRVEQLVPPNTSFADGRFEYFITDAGGTGNVVFTSFSEAVQDNQWHMYSSIQQFTGLHAQSGYYMRSFSVNATNASKRRNHMIIDLTDAFGEGNEPTKEWCDENIPYFTGTLSNFRHPNPGRGSAVLHSIGHPSAKILTTLNPSFITNGTLVVWYKKDSSAMNYNSGNFLMATQANSGQYLCATNGDSQPFNGSCSYNHWYVDGIEQNKSNFMDTNWHMYSPTGINLSSWTSLSFHAHGDDSWLYRGDIAEIRLYNTELSADDIKELYETSASIDKNGNLYCREIVEV